MMLNAIRVLIEKYTAEHETVFFLKMYYYSIIHTVN